MGNQQARGISPKLQRGRSGISAGDQGDASSFKSSKQRVMTKQRKPRNIRKPPSKPANSSVVENLLCSIIRDDIPVMVALISTDAISNYQLRMGSKHLKRCCSQNNLRKPCNEQQSFRQFQRVRNYSCARYCSVCKIKSAKTSKR